MPRMYSNNYYILALRTFVFFYTNLGHHLNEDKLSVKIFMFKHRQMKLNQIAKTVIYVKYTCTVNSEHTNEHKKKHTWNKYHEYT